MANKKVNDIIETQTMSEKISKEKFRTTESFFDPKLYNQKGELNTKRMFWYSAIAPLTISPFLSWGYINTVFYQNNIDKKLESIFQLFSWKAQEFIMNDLIDNIKKVVWDGYTYTNFDPYVMLGIGISCIGTGIAINRKIKSKIEKKRFITEVLHNVGLSDKIYFLREEKKGEADRYVFKMYKHATFKGLLKSFEKDSKKEFLTLTKFEDVSFEPHEKNKSIYYLNIVKVPFPSMFDKEVAQLNNDLNTKHKIDGKHPLGFTNIEVKDFKGLTQKKVGDLYIDYFDLDEILIHMSTIGAAGSGKSVSFANMMNTHLNNLHKTDKIFIHDAGSVENVKVQKWIDNHPQKEYLKKKIYTSSTLDELEKILIKLNFIYQYRILTMNKSGENLYEGNMIILKIDEANIMMTALSNITTVVGKQTKRIDKSLEDVALLYRKAHIYIDIMMQSDLAQDNFNSTLKKQCQIKFALKNDGYIAKEFCTIAQEESNYHLDEFKKGEVLLYNSNNQDYTKFLGAYVGDDYLDKNHSVVKEVEPHILDLEMYDYIEQLEDKVFEEYEIVMQKEKKGLTKKEIEKIDIEIAEYKELLQKNLKELSQGIFLEEDKKVFELIDKDEYRKSKGIEVKVESKEEVIIDVEPKVEEPKEALKLDKTPTKIEKVNKKATDTEVLELTEQLEDIDEDEINELLENDDDIHIDMDELNSYLDKTEKELSNLENNKENPK